MDSGNSGSMQSSSGGDDQEFDSRGESISSFLNPSPHFSSISAPPQPPFLSHQNPSFFDPHLSQNLDHGAQYNNDSDLIWPRGLRSDHSFSNLGNSSSSPSLQSRTQSSIPAAAPFPGQSSSDGQASRAAPPQPSVIKNPKKRTRASRRAPTTVLTTDTTNFRQMVQEFTGIPTAPFSGSPYSRRLDLFSAASALRSGGHLDTLGPLYPLRPAAHKALSPFSSSPPLLNSTMIDAVIPTTTIANTNTNNNNNLGASTSNNPNNFQLSGDHQFLNIQHHHGNIPSLQLGANPAMNFANLSGFLSRETQSAAAARGGDDHNQLSRWKSGGGETARNNDGIQENLVGFDGNISNRGDSQNLSGYNLNLAEKSMENVASSAAEGTAVASWICPSD